MFTKPFRTKFTYLCLGGIKFFWNELICKHFFQTLKTLTDSFPVADEFWVRCFWKSEDWLCKQKEWSSSCSNLGSESNTLRKCLSSAVMHVFLETNIATKGCSRSQHSPAWGYAHSTFPRYICSSCSYICFRSNLASAGSNRNERRTAEPESQHWDSGYFLGLLPHHSLRCCIVTATATN